MISFAYDQSNVPLIVCDTNVWYWIAEGKFEKPKNIELSPTSLSIMELATSEVMAHETSLFQKAFQSIYEHGSSIIALNPFDYVLNNHDPSYRCDNTPTINVLGDITEILKRDISDDDKLDFELKAKIITACKESRKSTYDFAEFSTEKLTEIRKNINKGVGMNNHLKEDTTENIKEMIKALLNEYVKDTSYEIDFINFDWRRIELFLTVTEVFFKKLETTRNMKIKPNDAVDWFNMLYVTPNDQYLTFEKTWRTYIESDNRISHYLFKS